MFNSATLPMTLRKMINMTVATTVATVHRSALMKVRMPVRRLSQRVKTLMGTTKMRTKDRQADVRKKPNMTFEAILIRSRISLMSEGRLTMRLWLAISASFHPIRQQLGYTSDLLEAPASNSFLNISTGLNQYSVFGLEQYVTPSPL